MTDDPAGGNVALNRGRKRPGLWIVRHGARGAGSALGLSGADVVQPHRIATLHAPRSTPNVSASPRTGVRSVRVADDADAAVFIQAVADNLQIQFAGIGIIKI